MKTPPKYCPQCGYKTYAWRAHETYSTETGELVSWHEARECESCDWYWISDETSYESPPTMPTEKSYGWLGFVIVLILIFIAGIWLFVLSAAAGMFK